MSNTNTGGPAFPGVEYKTPAGGGSHMMTIVGGMTLRDYFAGQALASINLGISVTDAYYSQTAKHCYALADAMLKARES